MTLPAKIDADAHAALPEAVRGEYVELEGGGGFRLDVGEVDGLKLGSFDKLEGTLTRERNARREAERKATEAAGRLQAFGDLDPDEATDLADKVRKMSKWTPDEKLQAKIDEAVRGVKTAHTEQAKDWEQRDARRVSQIKRYVVRDTVIRELAECGCVDDAEIVFPHVAAQIGTTEKEGELVAFVAGEDGQPRPSANPESPHEYMTVRELVGTFRKSDKFKRFFGTDVGRGSGAGGGARGGKGATGKNPWDPKHRNLTEQMRITKENPQEAERLRSLATGAA
jgi:hypothetical protein